MSVLDACLALPADAPATSASAATADASPPITTFRMLPPPSTPPRDFSFSCFQPVVQASECRRGGGIEGTHDVGVCLRRPELPQRRELRDRVAVRPVDAQVGDRPGHLAR